LRRADDAGALAAEAGPGERFAERFGFERFGLWIAREREVVALKFHAGLRNTEIAGVLGVSESAAGTLLYRAMQKLREACDATS